jgi:hypothetical protein
MNKDNTLNPEDVDGLILDSRATTDNLKADEPVFKLPYIEFKKGLVKVDDTWITVNEFNKSIEK